MKLKVKDMDIGTGGPLIAILNKKDAANLDFHNEDRIRITKGKKAVIAALDIAQTGRAVKSGHIGLFEEILTRLNAKHNDEVHVHFSPKPASITYIRERFNGKKFTQEQLQEIVSDIVANRLTEIELTAFVVSTYINEMDMDEITWLTNAMINTGCTIKIKTTNKHPVVDLHCIGGVAGNKTTLLIVPILASLGFYVPKTSSRAITSPSGTADTLELLCDVCFPISKIKQIVKKTHACMIWGGSVNLAPADDKIITVEYPLSMDAPGQLIASIMAKKGAVHPSHILIDIPAGKEAKVKTRKQALNLKRQFEKVGKKLKIKVKVVITDGSQPIGNGIGVALEVKDTLLALENDPKAPKDLVEKSINLCAELIRFVKRTSLEKARKMAIETIKNGSARKKFFEIIRAQGGKAVHAEDIKLGDCIKTIKSRKSGRVRYINNRFISKIAKLAGSPKDKKAGVYLFKHVGDKVRKNEPIIRIYAESRQKCNFAARVYRQIDGILIK